MVRMIIYILCFLLISCMKLPQGVKDSLELAQENKHELKQVLRHYHRNKSDSLKFRAACFLIDHMKCHYSTEEPTDFDSPLWNYIHIVDSVYYNIVRNKNNELLNEASTYDSLWKIAPKVRKHLEKTDLLTTTTSSGKQYDLKTVDHRFLTGHIDNAFKAWETSPFARHLTFDEFCEYILPYRSIYGYCHNEPGNRLSGIFNKYVHNGTGGNIREYVERYNLAVNQSRILAGDAPTQRALGFYDLLFYGKYDCIGIAEYGCNTLRACGMPVVVEFNAAYRDFTDKHYHCAIKDSTGSWITFNPESTLLPGDGDAGFAITLNIFRFTYAAQPESPFFVKNKEEKVPPLFDNPCIREVTSHIKEVAGITLPMPVKTDNRLAYLYSFTKNQGGMTPATWGKIENCEQSVYFPQVLYNILYFPVYIDGDQTRLFGEPFYLLKDTTLSGGVRFCYLTDNTMKPETGTITLNRKFPQKPSMLQIAEEMVGGRFTGANRKDFKDEVTLCTIKNAPRPYLQDLSFDHTKEYRYYRYIAPEAHPHSNIAMLEFLTDPAYQYTNTAPASPLPDFRKKEHQSASGCVQRVKLLDEPLEKMSRKPEYDGDMTTSSGVYPTITLRLQEPQVVQGVRFAPLNADNGIRPGDTYRLMYWDNGWKKVKQQKATGYELCFTNVPLHKIYWLQNLDRGREEMPFIIREGKQQFVYYGIIP